MADHDLFDPTSTSQSRRPRTLTPTCWTHRQLMFEWAQHSLLDTDPGPACAVQTDCGGTFSGWSLPSR